MMYNGQDTFEKLLKEKGLKVTQQRIAILEVLQSRPDRHLTAIEIFEIIKDKDTDIGLATVYRTIQLLHKLNLIDKFDLNDGVTRYEISRQGNDNKLHRHHHLICLKCHNIFTFQSDLLEPLEQRINETIGFDVIDHEVKIYGYCINCKGK